MAWTQKKHNCVIMEELDVDVVTNNKELFQRNSNGVRLKQSKTGMFSEWYYLHGLPFVWDYKQVARDAG